MPDLKAVDDIHAVHLTAFVYKSVYIRDKCKKIREHLKNCGYHVLRTAYSVPRNSYRNVIKCKCKKTVV